MTGSEKYISIERDRWPEESLCGVTDEIREVGQVTAEFFSDGKVRTLQTMRNAAFQAESPEIDGRPNKLYSPYAAELIEIHGSLVGMIDGFSGAIPINAQTELPALLAERYAKLMAYDLLGMRRIDSILAGNVAYYKTKEMNRARRDRTR